MNSTETMYSSPALIYGIPIIDIAISFILVLFFLNLFCLVKKKRYFMKKSSYFKIFIILFALFFIYNAYNMYNSSWFYDTYTKSWTSILWPSNPFFIILNASIASLIEMIIPYIIIILSINIIDCCRNRNILKDI